MNKHRTIISFLTFLLFISGIALLNESWDTFSQAADKYLNTSYPFSNVSSDSYNAITKYTEDLLSNPPPEPECYYAHRLKAVINIKRLLDKNTYNNNNAFNAALAFGLLQHNDFSRKERHVLEIFCNKIVDKEGLNRPMNSVEQALIGYVILELYNQTKEVRYQRAAVQIYRFLFESSQRSALRLVPYREAAPETMLVDTLGMICPFLTYYGTQFHEPKATEMAIHQLKDFISHGLDDDTMLPYHAYNARSDGPGFGILGWTRGTGWLLLGLIGTLEHLSREHPDYPIISDAFHKILNAVLKYQKTDGTFGWALSIPQSDTDTSGTAMIGYAVEKGMELGVLDTSYSKSSQKTMLGILRNTKKNGMIDHALFDVQGVGHYPAHFGNNCWGQGFSMAFYALLYDRSLN
jgi:rhamnogalacturonyl hydrolase YesR